MPENQLHLFLPDKPLLRRFGDEFFKTIPNRPGVYIMTGETDRVLYIGQSKNLRHRLASYKNARIDRAPRKVIRLIHQVRSIVWEECGSSHAARLKENELLRIHRPRFNVQNTFPQAYQYIVLETVEAGLCLNVTSAPGSGGKVFGAFKGGCLIAFGALLRLLFCSFRQPHNLDLFPERLLGSQPPRRYLLQAASSALMHQLPEWSKLLEKYLAGESGALVQLLTSSLPAVETISRFQHLMQLNDLEILTMFFELGPGRNFRLRQHLGVTESLIAQNDLDDLLVFKSAIEVREN